jgi:orotidine-5'-phosphate decarboxylase
MFNVHAAGGRAMMESAAVASEEAASIDQHPVPLVLGVTVLSSLDSTALHEDLGLNVTAEEWALHLAKLSKSAGLDGVVAGGGEVSAIREACGPDFIIMTPGIRPKGSDLGDQRRVLTPAEAIRRGSTYLGMGRPVTRAHDPVAALQAILEEIDSAT